MDLHGQINAACESRPGHPQPCHWPVWIVLECGFHVNKMDFSSCGIVLGFGKSSHIWLTTSLFGSKLKSSQIRGGSRNNLGEGHSHNVNMNMNILTMHLDMDAGIMIQGVISAQC